MLRSNINRVNFACAIVFIVILLASISLTGSSFASLTQPFGQLQHQETPLKLWTVDSSINNSKTVNVTKPNVTRVISSNATNATNTKAISTSFNLPAHVSVQKLITNVAGPVHINFVNSYWTSNTAQDQFVAATQSGLERLLNSNLGNQFLTGSPSGPSSDIALQPVIKQEVAPGEGPSVLAVTLINEGFSSITSITASLKLPQGFEPLITPCCSSIPGANSQTALSSFDGIVEPGDAFTIYFNVRVLGNAQVGKQYNSDLQLGYVKVTELRAKLIRSEMIAVPFAITGRVILDLASYSPPISSLSNLSSLINSSSLVQTLNLIPGVPNAVKLSLRNDGSATARGVIANIGGVTAATVVAPGVTTQITVASNVSAGIAAQPTSSSTVVLGPKVFNIGIVPPGGSKNISLVIYPSIAAAGTTQTLTLTLSFDDAYGNRQSANQLIGLQILPISPQTGLTVTPSSPLPTSPSPPPSSPPSTSPSPPPSSPATSSGNEMLTKIATFVHSPSNTNIGIRTPYPSPPNPSSSSPYSPIQLVAGKIQNVTFAINNGQAAASPVVSPIQNSISDLAVSLVSKSSFARILGPSTWNLPTLPSGSGQKLTTEVFASTSLIGNPVVFNVTIQYVQNGHRVKTASFDLGAIVVGDIQLKVNNLGIRYFGNTPALVGSILNEGNTPAQFANVEMLEQGQDQLQSQTPSNNNLTTILIPGSSQYLGDIATNSPKSFNIPLQASHVPISKSRQQNNIGTNKNEAISSLTAIALNSSSMKPFGANIDPGIYRVLLKITYIDDLKNSHELIVDSPLQIKPTQAEGSYNQGNDLIAILACGVAIGTSTIFISKWLRSKGNENAISTTYKILSRITIGRVKAVASIAHPPDEKKAGAPFCPL